MPDDKTFWDKIAPKYIARPMDDAQSYEATLADLSARLTPEMSVLEVGCGSGRTVRALAPHCGQILGTDIAPAMIAHARALPDLPPNASFRVAPATERLAEAPFDMIVALNLIHLIPDMGAGLATLRAMLKPDGLFISKTPCVGDMSRFIPLVIGAMKLVGKAPRTVHTLTTPQLVTLIEEAGFDILSAAPATTTDKRPYIVARPT